MKTFYAVIHARHVMHGIAQAKAALEAGAHGIALIDQHCSAMDVFAIAQALPGQVLVNLLNRTDFALRRAMLNGYGVWADSFDPDCETLLQALAQRVTVLGGVGFKYQHEQEIVTGWNLAKAVQLGVVPMTSGPATGKPPDLSKIKLYRELMGEGPPLAIASGMNARNLPSFLPLASHFLIGNAIEEAGGIVVPELVREIAAIIRGFPCPPSPLTSPSP